MSVETPTRGILHQINLGRHHLLIMHDQSIQLVHDECEQQLQVLSLESTEAYRLMRCLQDLFKSMHME